MKLLTIALILLITPFKALCGTTDLEILTEVIYHEARGESFKGQVAVGQVVMNRLHSKKYPDTLIEIQQQYKQFSYYGDCKTNDMEDKKAVLKSFFAALDAYIGIYKVSLAKKSLMYKRCDVNVKWDMSKISFDGQIGKHCFYSDMR